MDNEWKPIRMPSSRVLKSIANGLVGTFVSRNNDVLGYWGIGQIQREIEGLSDTVVELDLMHGVAMPEGPIAKALIAQYSTYLLASLARDGFTPSELTAAKILVEFGNFGEAEAPDLFSTTGQPFNCRAVLTSKSGKTFSAVRGGLSRPHNPAIELRSLRAQ
ncbi:hypothetical protein [Dyella japonica]|uniref:Uncharacterized protein n=1 Tax=Dyella japonica TaxID=231455 RepID=A0ABV2JR85_9GAMM